MIAQIGAALLDALWLSPQPTLIVRADLQVDWLNETATRFAARGLAVGIRNGRLTVREAAARTRVKSMLRTVCATDGDPQRGAGAAVEELLIADPALIRPLRLLMVPLFGGVLGVPTSANAPPHSGGEGGRALLFVEATPAPPSLEQAQLMFGLTPAEAETALDLLRGATPAEIAGRRGVSLNTVRSHIRRVLEKSETTRVTEFIARMLGVS